MNPVAHFNGTELHFSLNGRHLKTEPFRAGRKVWVWAGKHGIAPLRTAAGEEIEINWPEHIAEAGKLVAEAMGFELVETEADFTERHHQLMIALGMQPPVEYVPVAKIKGEGLGKDGLPNLSGTEKQIAWAKDIRREYAIRNPGSAELKRGKTAKYWIDNHRSILPRR